MKSLAIIVSGGSTNNLIQVLTLLMASVHSELKTRVFFRDESVGRPPPAPHPALRAGGLSGHHLPAPGPFTTL